MKLFQQFIRLPRITDRFIILMLIIPSSIYITFAIAYNHGYLKVFISVKTSKSAWININETSQEPDQRSLKSATLLQNDTDNYYSQSSSRVQVPSTTQLILFTTFPVNITNPYRLLAQRTTIRNWAQMRPFLQPVLFTDQRNATLVQMAIKAKWHVLSQTAVNKFGTPLLKPMVSEILKRYPNVPYYGFANGDIQFDGSLMRTLNRVKEISKHLQHNILIVGVRKNLDMNITASESIYNISNIPNLVRFSKSFMVSAEDYFIFSRAGNKFNWSSIANVVIGRPAYDNYLVAEAIRMNVNVIDASKTLLALHMSKPNNNREGFHTKDADYNTKVIGRYVYANGRLNAAKLITAYNIFGEEVVVRR